jgi:signal peptidase I
MPARHSKSCRTALRSCVIATVAAAFLLGPIAGSSPAAAEGFSMGFRTYSVPSTSMAPTILINEFVFAVEWPRVSRGDLVTYLLPQDNQTIFIKRVIGLPGDRIRMIGGRLHVNGEPVGLERVEDFEMQDFDGRPRRVPQYRETLPGGRSHRILDMVENGFLDNTQEYAVPDGHYFMMGDNRDNSSDSRVLARHGYVPARNILHRPEMVYFSMAEGESAWRFWRWPWSMRWGRMFARID